MPDAKDVGVQPTRRALIVEDEALVAMVAEESLRFIGFEPVSVGTGEEALRAMGDGQIPALAMIDVGLPDIRGDELAAHIRRLAPHMPIIVASGYDEAELASRFTDDLATTVLAKPYTEAALARAIAGLGLTLGEAI